MNNNQSSWYVKKFKYGFTWNLGGSIVYEVVKTIYNFFLIQFLTQYIYGSIGGVLSIIYLAVKVADVGTTHALPPFFSLIQKNKHFFRYIFWKNLLLPQIPAIIITCIGGTFFCFYKFLSQENSLALWFLPFLIILETYRSFFRYFLHFSFKSPFVVSFEVGSFLCFVGFVWLGLFYLNIASSLNVILLAHIIDSAFIVSVFSFLIYKNYKRLPETQEKLPLYLKKRIFKMRFFNYLLRLSRDLFTNNFLTPLFAVKFGLEKIGLFFFAGSIATSMQSVIKGIIGYSGTALLASVKHEPLQKKKQAFQLLSKNLLSVILPILIFICCHVDIIIGITNQHTPATFILGALTLFVIILSIEFFFMLYEQFYIMEERTQQLFFIKIFQFILLYLTIGLAPNSSTSILATFSGIVLVRSISFILVALNGYMLWGLKPQFYTKKRIIIAAFFVSIIIHYILAIVLSK